MKLSPEERFRKRMSEMGRRGRLQHICSVPLLAVGTFCLRGAAYIQGNGKRLSILASCVLLFMAYTSFSFPGGQWAGEHGGGLNSHISEEAANITLAVEAEIDLGEIRIWDEADMLWEEYYRESLDGIQGHGLQEEEENGQEAASSPTGGGSLQETAEGRDSVSFSRDDWRLRLVNKQNSIPADYEVPLGSIQALAGTMQCDERIIDELLAMQKAAAGEGITLTVCSPHRDYQRQQMLFDRKIRKYLNLGMSYMEAYQLSSQIVMVPGASEHQLGLALDIVTTAYLSLDEGFADTPAGIWLAENSWKYGFVVRYPKGKETITGVEYEPWHFRYVGVEAAEIMTEEGITLEEFWEEYL